MTGELIYHEAEWPFGLRCMDCDRLLVEGEAYSRQLTGFIGDQPVSDIVCVPCAMEVRA